MRYRENHALTAAVGSSDDNGITHVPSTRSEAAAHSSAENRILLLLLKSLLRTDRGKKTKGKYCCVRALVRASEKKPKGLYNAFHIICLLLIASCPLPLQVQSPVTAVDLLCTNDVSKHQSSRRKSNKLLLLLLLYYCDDCPIYAALRHYYYIIIPLRLFRVDAFRNVPRTLHIGPCIIMYCSCFLYIFICLCACIYICICVYVFMYICTNT